MSYKISFILSMVFVTMFFLFSGDMISLQFIYSDLDAKSVTISYLISEHGSLDQPFIDSIENKYNIEFVSADNYTPLFGEEVTYVIAKTYKPLMMSKETMTVSVQRTTVIGYYH